MTRRITYNAILAALSLIMFLIENLFPPIFVFAPGVRLGLSNAFMLLALLLFSPIDALLVLIIKCVLSSVFTGNMFSIVYSLPSGLLSLSVMYVCIYFVKKLGIVAVSLLGSTVHNLTQLVVAGIVVNSFAILNYVPIMLIASSLAGIFNGFVVYLIIRYLPRSTLYFDIKKLKD